MSFILFQPDYSFAVTHNVGMDHPPMPEDLPPEKWTAREKTRRRFTAAGKSSLDL